MATAQQQTLPPLAAPWTLSDPQPAAMSGVPWRQRYQISLRVTDSLIVLASVLLAPNVMVFSAGMVSLTEAFVGLATAAGWLLALSIFRTRDPRSIGDGATEYKRVIQASAATAGWLAVAVLIIDAGEARHFIIVSFPAGMAALLTSRWIWRRWLTKQREFGHFLSKVVVIGRRADVAYVVDRLSKKAGAVYQVVGVVLEGKAEPGAFDAGARTVRAVAGLTQVEKTVEMTGADAVVVAGHLRKGSSYIRELGWRLERTSTELVLASSLTNVAGPRIQMRPVEGLPLMHVESPQFSGGRHLVKRAMDIVLSAGAIIMLLPIFGVLAVLVYSDSRGPVFFSQERVGKQASRFRMYKFRSMVVDAESRLGKIRGLNQGNSVLFKVREDPRVTHVGRWLRKYSLDELPQLVNVFRGDMSLVGPRPPLPAEVKEYEGHTHRRLFIKPGLTGLWQINGRSDLSWEESVRLDLYYVENWSVTGDLMIMWRTFKVLIKATGAY